MYHEPCSAKIIQIPEKELGETLTVQSLQPLLLNGCCCGTQPNFLLSNGPPSCDLIGWSEVIDRWWCDLENLIFFIYFFTAFFCFYLFFLRERVEIFTSVVECNQVLSSYLYLGIYTLLLLHYIIAFIYLLIINIGNKIWNSIIDLATQECIKQYSPR